MCADHLFFQGVSAHTVINIKSMINTFVINIPFGGKTRCFLTVQLSFVLIGHVLKNRRCMPLRRQFLRGMVNIDYGCVNYGSEFPLKSYMRIFT